MQTMDDYRLQSVLFHQINKKGYSNAAKLMQEVLGVNKSSAYRRKRGETPLTLDEAYKLCKHCGITLENIIAKTEGQIVINMASVDEDFKLQLDYPKYLLGLLRYITSLPDCEIIYLTNEIPVCYFFTSPLLAAFKTYVWGRNTFHQEALAERSFQPELFMQNPEFKEICREMIDLYEKIERTEIWTTSILRRSMAQIAYCRDVRLFTDDTTEKKLTRNIESILRKTLSDKPHYNKTAQPRHLYYQPYFSAEDIILIKTKGIPVKVISTFFNPDYFISDESRLLSRSVIRLDYLIRKSEIVDNEKAREAMHKTMFKQIRDKSRNRRLTEQNILGV